MPTVAAESLRRLTRDVFAARGVPVDDAVWIAEQLVRANLRGHDSHGVIRIPSYVRIEDETWRQIQECAAEVGVTVG